MPAELNLAPVGAGKTELALARIAAKTSANPFARVWVLLPTERQVTDFRNRLIQDQQARRVFFNVEFFTFYDLYKRVLDAAGQPTRELAEAARLRLLRVLAEQLRQEGRLNVYGTIADKAGFIRILADFIYELKRALIDPQTFAQAAQSAFQDRNKDTEIATLYDAYQSRLREHDVVDREGEGWLALAVLAENKQVISSVDLLVVDGYDQFTRVQAQLVALLSERVGETLITLTTVPGREQTVGRRFVQAQVELQAAFDLYEQPLPKNKLTAQVEQRDTALQSLADRIFQLNLDPVPSEGAVRFITAPDAATETAAVMREIKRLLLPNEDGSAASPEDILLVLRDYERYRVHIQTLGHAYGLPLALHLGQPLVQVPPIRALMDVLTLHDRDIHLMTYPRRALMDALHTPYFSVNGLDGETLDALDLISRTFAVVGDRAAWVDACHRAALPRTAGEDDTVRQLDPLFPQELCNSLAAALTDFFDTITPRRQDTVENYVRWLEHLMGDDDIHDPDDEDAPLEPGVLHLVRNIRRGHDETLVSRDLAAVDSFKQVLRGMLAANLLLQTLENTGETVPWGEFFGDLRAAVERMSIESRPSRTGRVLVTTAADARGLPHQHVFIMGLSEGIFPLRVSEDPLYLDDERDRLHADGLPIQSTAAQAADDGLFYELISLAMSTLALSRPSVKDGAPWVESHLWRAAAAVFSDADALIAEGEARPGAVVSLTQAATPDEIALSVAHAFTSADADSSLMGAYNWLLENQRPLWRHIRTGQAVEAGRIALAPHDRYTGLIDEAPLLKELSKLLGPNHRWSASQLNDYGTCPFRFFAGRVLRLEALEEPDIGVDARQLGSLNHTILEKTYSTLASEGVVIQPANLDHALAVLEMCAAAVFSRGPDALGFRASPVWEQEKTVLLNRLRALVSYDFTEMNDHLEKKGFGTGPRTPYILEAPFGIGQHGTLFQLGDNRSPVFVTGYIDRIDRFGDDALVLDYKTGGSPIALTELEEGRNFQIMFYMLAAQGLLDARRQQAPDTPRQVAGGFFWHIRSRATSGELTAADHNDLIEGARQHIARYIHRAQHGDFTVSPTKPALNGRCTSYCEFYRLCRSSVTNLNKKLPQ